MRANISSLVPTDQIFSKIKKTKESLVSLSGGEKFGGSVRF